jgi:hypothetical protein
MALPILLLMTTREIRIMVMIMMNIFVINCILDIQALIGVGPIGTG